MIKMIKTIKSSHLDAPACWPCALAHWFRQGGAGRHPPLARGGAWARAPRPRADLVERWPVTSPRRDAYAVGKL
ncbi:hypothetical protein HispidOSU_019775, partial [Sigmodon hispidus]